MHDMRKETHRLDVAIGAFDAALTTLLDAERRRQLEASTDAPSVALADAVISRRLELYGELLRAGWLAPPRLQQDMLRDREIVTLRAF